MNNPCSYPTIGSVRQRLADLGIQVTGEQIELVRKMHSTERLRIALDHADTDPDVYAFLSDTFARVGPGTHLSLFPEDAQTDRNPPDSSVACGKQVAAEPEPVMPSPREARALWRLPDSRETMVGHGERSHLVPTLATIPAREDFHIYGGTAALTVSPGKNKAGYAVVFIDAAEANQPRQYDWGSKITVMLTPEEMIVALAVVTGGVPSASFKHHGKTKDKWMQIQHQGSNVFIKVGQANVVRAIPLGPVDAFNFAALLTAQIKSNVPEGARADVTQLVQSTVVPMLATPSPPATGHSTRRRSNTPA
jgi:hypothetical protein